MASAMVHCPTSDTDYEKTEQHCAHKSRTSVCGSDVNVVLVNAFDKGLSNSDLAWRISSSVVGVFVTALECNWSGNAIDTEDK